MGGYTPGENFLGGNFPARSFPGENGWVGIFREGIPPGEIFLGLFSSYNESSLIFLKNY